MLCRYRCCCWRGSRQPAVTGRCLSGPMGTGLGLAGHAGSHAALCPRTSCHGIPPGLHRPLVSVPRVASPLAVEISACKEHPEDYLKTSYSLLLRYLLVQPHSHVQREGAAMAVTRLIPCRTNVNAGQQFPRPPHRCKTLGAWGMERGEGLQLVDSGCPQSQKPRWGQGTRGASQQSIGRVQSSHLPSHAVWSSRGCEMTSTAEWRQA